MSISEKKKLQLNGVVTEDPIEREIMLYLHKLILQNKRFKEYIEKTGAWTHIKDVNSWKSFDFLNYFKVKHREKYNKEYRVVGSVVRAYIRIEKFMQECGLSNAEYKEFIDLAYSRYFNAVVMPMLGNVCSKHLFERLMGRKVRLSSEELFELDQVIASESEKFENEIRSEAIFGERVK